MKKQNSKTKIKRSRNGSIERSAQGTIPFLEWYENKIFKVTENTYSLICSFDNTGYLSKTEAEKERKYRSYMQALCQLPSYIHYQEIIYNCPVDATHYLSAVASKSNPYANKYEEAFFKVQRSFVTDVDKDHSVQKYLFVISITVEGDESPYNKLHETIVMLSDKFRDMGSTVKVLSSEEVFEELYRMYNPFSEATLKIPKDIYKRGLTVKDFLAPDGIAFGSDHIKLGTKFARVLAVASYGNVATDNLMYVLTASDIKVSISKHIEHINKDIAVKQINRHLAEFEGRKKDRLEKKRFVPVELERSIEGCVALLNSFSNGEEFLRQTVYITVYAETLEKLNLASVRIKNEALSQNTSLRYTNFQTKSAFNSALPLGKDYCTMHQFLLAGEAAVMTPFSYESYFDKDGFYYGKNYHSNEPIIRNRKKDKSSHGFVFGNTGSGKGMWTKNEISNVLFQPFCSKDEIIILDPSGEYIPIANAVGGKVIEFSANGSTHINPLFVSEKRIELEGAQASKVAKIQSLISLMSELKGGGGLDGIERAIIDRAAMNALEKPSPTLQTLYDEISESGTSGSDSIITWLRRYTEGSVSLFAGEDTTEGEIGNKLTVYALHRLPIDIRDAVMLVMLDKIEDRLLINHKAHKWTWIYIDEMHRYFDADRNPYAAERFARLYAEARKYGGILTGITQLPKAVIASRDGATMLSNSRFVVMSELDDANIAAVADKYDLNEDQKRTLSSADIGEYVLRTNNSPMSIRLLYPGAKPGEENAMFDLFNTSFSGG